MTSNPFSPKAYELDFVPTPAQVAVLERIEAGDRIVVDRRGKAWTWERSQRTLAHGLVSRLIDNQWIVRPDRDGPLFDHQGGGRLTARSQFALLRYHTTHT